MGCQMYGLPIIVKSRNADITIGENCHIKSGFLTNLIGLSQRSIICERDNAKIKIGNGGRAVWCNNLCEKIGNNRR